MDLLVTENVFYNQAVDRVYDLKGSERSRYASDDPSDAGAVLLDANLRESNLSAPILVSAQAWEGLFSLHLCHACHSAVSITLPMFVMEVWCWLGNASTSERRPRALRDNAHADNVCFSIKPLLSSIVQQYLMNQVGIHCPDCLVLLESSVDLHHPYENDCESTLCRSWPQLPIAL